MAHLLRTFFPDEDGAVTVDWVVLTAAVVGIVLAAYASIESGSGSMADAVGTYMTDTTPEDLHSR